MDIFITLVVRAYIFLKLKGKIIGKRTIEREKFFWGISGKLLELLYHMRLVGIATIISELSKANTRRVLQNGKSPLNTNYPAKLFR